MLNSLYPLLIKVPLRSQVKVVKIAGEMVNGEWIARFSYEQYDSMRSDIKTDWRYIRKFSLKVITLPIWLSIEEYIQKQNIYESLWYMCPKTAFNAQIQRKLALLYRFLRDPYKIQLCLQLLAREDSLAGFKASLCGTLENWLVSQDSPYDSPFSPQQWAALGDSR